MTSNLATTNGQPPAPRPEDKPPAPAAQPVRIVPTPAAQAPGAARFRARHWLLVLSFLLLVVAPAAAGIAYLYLKAADQYHSTVSFSVRSEDTQSPADILGFISQSSGSSASDSDILYEFIRSQQMVEEVSRELDLVAIFNRPEGDPIFTLGENPTIEDLHWYWEWMVSVAYDSSAGIISVEARAFNPEDARAVADMVVARSTALINALSSEAKQDAIRFAQQDLEEAEKRLRDIRRELRAFRDVEQQVDPTADFEQRMGLRTALEEELAKALVSRDVLTGFAELDDSRVRTLDRRIAAIRERLEAEKSKFGAGEASTSGGGERLAEVVGVYEELVMDREFASQAYMAVLSSFENARAEARRQHRYLATHIGPTQAERSLFPQRALLSVALVFMLSICWFVLVLIIFNVRDSR